MGLHQYFKRAVIGSPVKRIFNGVSLLGSVIFQVEGWGLSMLCTRACAKFDFWTTFKLNQDISIRYL